MRQTVTDDVGEAGKVSSECHRRECKVPECQRMGGRESVCWIKGER